jgi:hypothetical protein
MIENLKVKELELKKLKFSAIKPLLIFICNLRSNQNMI